MTTLKMSVDNTAELFGDKVSIADLAQFSFNGEDSNTLHVYRADQILMRDWRDELSGVELENGCGVYATFKDGSRLSVSTWADCCTPADDEDHRGCRWCNGRY